MRIFDRYILKTHAAPLLFGFFTIMFVFILSFLTRFIDDIVGKGLDLWVLIELVLLQSAWMVSFALPMSVLIATVMAFGTLTNSSEMTVMRSGGISIYRLVAPVLLVSVLISVANERINNVLLPGANYQANTLLSDISRLKPALSVGKGSFSDIVPGYSLMAEGVDDKTGELRGVVMYDTAHPGVRSVVTAARGRIAFTPDYGRLVMTLEDGEIHELVLPGMAKYRRIAFRKHRYLLETSDYGFDRSGRNEPRSGRELSATQLRLRAEAHLAKAAGLSVGMPDFDHNLSQYRKLMVEYYKKYSLAFACLAFAVVGAPLGVMARRGGFGVGAGLSLLFFVLYWAMMIGGEKLADRGFITPGMAAWTPDLLLAIAGATLLYRLNHSVTGSGK